jgi:hypothetical protein
MGEGHSLLFGPASRGVSGGKRSSQSGLRRGDREVQTNPRYLLNGLPPHSEYSLRWSRFTIHTTLEEALWFLCARPGVPLATPVLEGLRQHPR